MLAYNVHEADDLVPKTYLYTLCPQNAACTSLDFTLLESAANQDFIRIFDGPDRDAPLLTHLGGKSGSRLVQASSGCLTFEFTRVEGALQSVWTALWQGAGEEDCINPQRKNSGKFIQDVCGPEYRENRSLWRSSRPDSNLPSMYTYRFRAARDGHLNFTILPDNEADDYDWELYTYLPAPDTATADTGPQKVYLARNFASGAGPGGATGMVSGGKGGQSHSLAKGAYNPYHREVAVHHGWELFLNVHAGEPRCHGFRLLLNEAVLQCEQPVGELIQLSHEIAHENPRIPAQDAFSRSTQIWRLDLAAKANAGLADSPVSAESWSDLLGMADGGASDHGHLTATGLPGVLLTGLKAGLFPAYAAHDFKTPLHYGNLLELASRMNFSADSDSVPEGQFSSGGDWWNPDPSYLEGFGNMLELIVDEAFDKNSGRRKIQIKYVRLVWSDWEGEQPDYNVAIFRYSDLKPALGRIRVRDFRNEARNISMQDLLESRAFEHVISWKSGNHSKTPAEGEYLRLRDQQLESYYWR